MQGVARAKAGQALRENYTKEDRRKKRQKYKNRKRKKAAATAVQPFASVKTRFD